jgi:hypothetical protein
MLIVCNVKILGLDYRTDQVFLITMHLKMFIFCKKL